MFWEISPQKHNHIQILYNCKLFRLRGIDEHRTLSIGQLKLHEMNDEERPYIVFRGRSSKTYKGKFNLLHVTYNPIKQGLILIRDNL